MKTSYPPPLSSHQSLGHQNSNRGEQRESTGKVLFLYEDFWRQVPAVEVGQENCSWWSHQDLTKYSEVDILIPEPTCVTARAHGTVLPEGEHKSKGAFQNSPSGAKSSPTKSHLNVGDAGSFSEQSFRG